MQFTQELGITSMLHFFRSKNMLYSAEDVNAVITFCEICSKIKPGSVWFYGISTIGGYLMPIPLYPYILNIYDLVWSGFMAYQLL